MNTGTKEGSSTPCGLRFKSFSPAQASNDFKCCATAAGVTQSSSAAAEMLVNLATASNALNAFKDGIFGRGGDIDIITHRISTPNL